MYLAPARGVEQLALSRSCYVRVVSRAARGTLVRVAKSGGHTDARIRSDDVLASVSAPTRGF